MDEYIVGRNAVREALRSNRPIQRVLVAQQAGKTTGKTTGSKGSLQEIIALAKERNIEVRRVPEQQIAGYAGKLPHQGVAAVVASVEFADLAEVLANVPDGDTPLLIMLDGIEDPHNMGAIIRTAECCGATAVLFPKRHSAPVNATVAKTSAGAVECIPLVQIGNVAQTLESLKQAGFWVLGAHIEGDRTLYEADMTVPLVLVIGNEGKGLSRLTKETCDYLVTIPMYGRLNSLNASVAAAVLMYEVTRQRHSK